MANKRERDDEAELAEAKRLAEDAKEENPDPVTERETFELDLMERGESEEGEKLELRPEGDAGPKKRT